MQQANGQAMQHTAVESSNITSVGYDPATSTLEVQFKNGGRYQYAGVPPTAHADVELLTQLCLAARELSRDQFRAADNLAGRIKALLPERA